MSSREISIPVRVLRTPEELRLGITLTDEEEPVLLLPGRGEGMTAITTRGMLRRLAVYELERHRSDENLFKITRAWIQHPDQVIPLQTSSYVLEIPEPCPYLLLGDAIFQSDVDEDGIGDIIVDKGLVWKGSWWLLK